MGQEPTAKLTVLIPDSVSVMSYRQAETDGLVIACKAISSTLQQQIRCGSLSN